jgi:hypothetical protein
MSGAITVAFVYLGGELPKYARNNLTGLVKKFPHLEFILISDKLENNDLDDVEFFFFDSSSTLNELTSKSSLDGEFRQGFWIHTMGRFAALSAYMFENPELPLIHFELDVWIAENFPFSIFESLDFEIAFSLPAASEGSAAVLYLRDYEAALKLSAIILNSIQKTPTSTDMTILREIYDNNLMSIKLLPISPEEETANNDPFAGFLFDPSTWGMYFLGQDPRNARGLQIFHREEKHHKVKPTKYDLVSDGRTIRVLKDSIEFSLVNLHVHSKDLRVFGGVKQSSKIIKKYLEKDSKGEFVEFKVRIFTQQLGKKFLKVIRYLVRYGRNE